MSQESLLNELRREREQLAAVLGPLERDQLINGHPGAFEAKIEAYKRQLANLDDLIAREAARGA